MQPFCTEPWSCDDHVTLVTWVEVCTVPEGLALYADSLLDVLEEVGGSLGHHMLHPQPSLVT